MKFTLKIASLMGMASVAMAGCGYPSMNAFIERAMVTAVERVREAQCIYENTVRSDCPWDLVKAIGNADAAAHLFEDVVQSLMDKYPRREDEPILVTCAIIPRYPCDDKKIRHNFESVEINFRTFMELWPLFVSSHATGVDCHSLAFELAACARGASCPAKDLAGYMNACLAESQFSQGCLCRVRKANDEQEVLHPEHCSSCGNAALHCHECGRCRECGCTCGQTHCSHETECAACGNLKPRCHQCGRCRECGCNCPHHE